MNESSPELEWISKNEESAPLTLQFKDASGIPGLSLPPDARSSEAFKSKTKVLFSNTVTEKELPTGPVNTGGSLMGERVTLRVTVSEELLRSLALITKLSLPL